MFIMVQKQKPKPQLSSYEDSRRHRIGLGLILSFVAFLLYVDTLNGGFVLDDASAITRNETVKQGIEGIPELLRTDYQAGSRIATGTLYRPLSLVMFAIEW